MGEERTKVCAWLVAQGFPRLAERIEAGEHLGTYPTIEERDRRIVERVHAGQPTKEIAASLGLSVSSVRTIFNKACKEMPRAALLAQKERRERDENILRRADIGEKASSIAKDLGLAAGTVAATIRTLGAERRVNERHARGEGFFDRITGLD